MKTILIAGGVGLVGVGLGVYLYKKHSDKVDVVIQKITPSIINGGNGGIIDKPTVAEIKVGTTCEKIKFFQRELNSLFPALNLPENSIYSKEMFEKIKPYFARTKGILNAENGNLSKLFVENFIYSLGRLREKNEAPIPTLTEGEGGVVTIKKGDKSKEVEKLQLLLRKLTKTQIVAELDLGAFTKETAIETVALFSGCTILYDKETAAISTNFINQFYNLIF